MLEVGCQRFHLSQAWAQAASRSPEVFRGCLNPGPKPALYCSSSIEACPDNPRELKARGLGLVTSEGLEANYGDVTAPIFCRTIPRDLQLNISGLQESHARSRIVDWDVWRLTNLIQDQGVPYEVAVSCRVYGCNHGPCLLLYGVEKPFAPVTWSVMQKSSPNSGDAARCINSRFGSCSSSVRIAGPLKQARQVLFYMFNPKMEAQELRKLLGDKPGQAQPGLQHSILAASNIRSAHCSTCAPAQTSEFYVDVPSNVHCLP